MDVLTLAKNKRGKCALNLLCLTLLDSYRSAAKSNWYSPTYRKCNPPMALRCVFDLIWRVCFRLPTLWKVTFDFNLFTQRGLAWCRRLGSAFQIRQRVNRVLPKRIEGILPLEKGLYP